MSQQHLKKPAIIALSALAVLVLGAMVLYKERMLYADASFFLFSIMNDGHLAIQTGRYGSIATQVFPYIGTLLKLPVVVQLISFSASFYLFPAMVASLLVFVYREYILAVGLGLFYFLLFSQSWYWVSEIPQGVTWMFLLLGTARYLGTRQTNVFIIALPFLAIGYLTVSTHFVVLIPTLFLWVYFILEKNYWPFSLRNTLLLSGLLLLLIGSIFAGSQGSDPRMHHVTHFNLQDLYEAFKTPAVYMFLRRCLTNYWIATALLVWGLWQLARSRRFLLLTWTVGCIVGYFAIMGLTFGFLDENVGLFHIESEWQGITIILITPFLFHVLPNLKPRTAPLLLAGIFLVRMVYIASFFPQFHWRVHFQQEVLAKMKQQNIQRLALHVDYDLNKKYILDWASSFESMLGQAMDGEPLQRSFIFFHDSGSIQLLNNPKLMYGTNWGAHVWLDKLNPTYFHADTTQPYSIMTYEQFFSR